MKKKIFLYPLPKVISLFVKIWVFPKTKNMVLYKGNVSFLLKLGILVLIALFPISAGEVGSDCTFKGIKLYGKVQIVSSFPDIKVQVVDSFPDLKVQMVNSFPNSCGKWQSVNSFPDFKIQFVTSFPDVKIKYENSFPGVP